MCGEEESTLYCIKAAKDSSDGEAMAAPPTLWSAASAHSGCTKCTESQ